MASSSSSATLRLVTGPCRSLRTCTSPSAVHLARRVIGQGDRHVVQRRDHDGHRAGCPYAPDGSVAVIDTSYALSPSAPQDLVVQAQPSAQRHTVIFIARVRQAEHTAVSTAKPNTSEVVGVCRGFEQPATASSFSSTFRVTLSGAASSPSMPRCSCPGPELRSRVLAGGLCTSRVGLATPASQYPSCASSSVSGHRQRVRVAHHQVDVEPTVSISRRVAGLTWLCRSCKDQWESPGCRAEHTRCVISTTPSRVRAVTGVATASVPLPCPAW